MSAKSKSSSKVNNRPFPPAILKRARALAARYQIILQLEDGEYYGRGLEMPYAMSEGRTPDECVRATRQALTVAIATRLESGEIPPAPASELRRSQQVNIRLTAEERLLLEELARSKGFRGVSDFVRSTTLAQVR